MQKIIVGIKGNLAKALSNYYPNSIQVARSDYIQWPRHTNKLEEFLSKTGVPPKDCILLNCAGITDIDADLIEMMFINTRLPFYLAEKSVELGFKLATFGTVMERFPKYAKNNQYLNSKLAFFEEYNAREDWNKHNVHFQMHTLYGGDNTKPKMFLGQIYEAINSQTFFSMTGGDQIREYHHIDDVVRAVGDLIEMKISGTHHISQGNPIKLADLAQAIFNQFNSTQLLNIAAKTADRNDNRHVIFEKPDELGGINFREPVEGVISWLQELGINNAGKH
jgi:dTDP-4-dehydrorhamnose reductase